jgi:hypothetical protein
MFEPDSFAAQMNPNEEGRERVPPFFVGDEPYFRPIRNSIGLPSFNVMRKT